MNSIHRTPYGTAESPAAQALLQKGLLSWDDHDPGDPPGRLPDQVAAARDALLAGTSPIDIRSQLSATYGAKAQPARALRNAIKAIQADEELRTANLRPIIQAIRFAAASRALAMGQCGPAAALLRDIETAAAAHGQDDGGHGLLITVEGAPEPQEALPEAVQVGEDGQQAPQGP